MRGTGILDLKQRSCLRHTTGAFEEQRQNCKSGCVIRLLFLWGGGERLAWWMMDNIFIRTDPSGNIKPDKEKSSEKIDGAVATIMALDRAIRCGNENGESVYDRRGLLFL